MTNAWLTGWLIDWLIDWIKHVRQALSHWKRTDSWYFTYPGNCAVIRYTIIQYRICTLLHKNYTLLNKPSYGENIPRLTNVPKKSFFLRKDSQKKIFFPPAKVLNFFICQDQSCSKLPLKYEIRRKLKKKICNWIICIWGLHLSTKRLLFETPWKRDKEF